MPWNAHAANLEVTCVTNSSRTLDGDDTWVRDIPCSHRMTTEELLAGLDPGTDLVRVVERVFRDKLPHLIVSAAAEEAWTTKDGPGWTRVREWLATRSVAIIRISEKDRT